MSTAAPSPETPLRARPFATPNVDARGEAQTTRPASHGATPSERTPPVGFPTSPTDHCAGDTQAVTVGGGSGSEAGAAVAAAPMPVSRPSLSDPTLYVLAQFLDDIEGLRKAQANRQRILTTTEPDQDGEIRGFGLDSTHPVVATIEALGQQLDAVEHQTILALNRAMRKHPLVFWQRSAKGVGEKQLARLLAATGDPYINATTGQPRTVSQLWAYCGLHTLPASHGPRDAHRPSAGGGTSPAGADLPSTPTGRTPLPGSNVAARRQRGVRSNWSTTAKTRAYLIATSCIKQDGDYRKVYDARRQHTAQTHPDWTPGHSHNDALRIVSKTVLKDVWRAARAYHEGQEVAR